MSRNPPNALETDMIKPTESQIKATAAFADRMARAYDATNQKRNAAAARKQARILRKQLPIPHRPLTTKYPDGMQV